MVPFGRLYRICREFVAGQLAEWWHHRARQQAFRLPAGFEPRQPWVSGLAQPPQPSAQPRAPLPQVTALVLNRNGADHLAALFASLDLHNSYPALDIILVDHGSEDDSLAIAAHWSDRLDLRILRCAQNYSFSFSTNRAAELARGEVLLLLNNDIVFTSDVIGRLVAAVQDADHGMVGVRQYHPLDIGSGECAGPEHHIGIRFRWNQRHRHLTPFNAHTRPGDALAGHSVARMPGVTGSVLLCRRDDYLAVGGLHEDYDYGYEDVDLCLKYRLGRGWPVLSCNDVAVEHVEGATRLKPVQSALRSQRHKHNLAVLDRRFGYALRRHEALALFGGDGWMTGRTVSALLVADAVEPDDPDSDYYTQRELGVALNRRFGWRIGFARADRVKSLVGIDLVLSATPRFRLDRIDRPGRFVVTAVWLLDRLDDWQSHPDRATWDLVLAAAAPVAAAFAAAAERPVTVLPRAANLDRFSLGYAAAVNRRGDTGLDGGAYRALPARFAAADRVELPPRPDRIGVSTLALSALAAGARPMTRGVDWAALDPGLARGIAAASPPARRAALLEAGYSYDRRALTVRDRLLAILAETFCFAIKVEAEPGPEIAQAAALLRRQGHRVRIDRRAAWSNRFDWRDDVIVLTTAPGSFALPAGRILFALPGAGAVETAHALLPTAPGPALAAALLAAASAWHQALTPGASDPPLSPRAWPPGGTQIEAPWERR